MTEATLQSKFILWLWNTHPGERYRFFHIPNGERRDKITAIKLKAMGLLPGVWDVLWFRKNNIPLFIEFKTETGKLTKEQERFRDVLKFDAEFIIIKSIDEFELVFKSTNGIESR